MTTTKFDISALVDEALDDFWDTVARHFPDATTGDLSPWTTIRLDLAAKAAIEEWIFNNVPDNACPVEQP